MKNQWILVGMFAGVLYAGNALAQHTTPNQQPPQATAPAVPTTETPLGSVQIPKGVSADGKPLPAGTYQIRLTAQEAKPDAVGTTETLERWVEFLQGKDVKGREVVSIVPAAETKMVVKDPPPPSGGSKVQTLKGGDYVRVWINRAGNQYLIYMPASAAGK